MYLSDFAFFTFTLSIIVFLGLLASWEHIDHYTDWNNKVHNRLKGSLDDVSDPDVNYIPPSTVSPAEIKDRVIELHSEKPNGIKIKEHVITRSPITYKNGDCTIKKINIYVDIIETAARHNINIFPRNGFLLGIVRNKGFLPNEKIDADLAMFESDYRPITMEGKYGNYQLRLDTQHAKWSLSWNGVHPVTGRELPSFARLSIDGVHFDIIPLFYKLKDDLIFYPFWVTTFNVKGGAKENDRWNKNGAWFVTEGRNKYNVFNASAWNSTIVKDFYHTKIRIPSGYESILVSFYGRDWGIPEQRTNWLSKPVKHVTPVHFLPLDVCPMSWGNCQELVGDRTDALYSQLSRLIPIINDTNYLLGYGSLLGLLRDGDMNANEVDNDIMVDKNFKPTFEFKMKLMREGLIIFKHDIWRICNYSPREVPKARPPWGDRYVPYTDIYNQLPDIKPFPEKSMKIPGIWRPTWRKLRNIILKTPDREFAEKWFYTRYGKTWRKPRVTDKWKIKVNKK